MTDTTAADELHAAARLLMGLADTAQGDLDTADYWKPYDKATAWRDGLTNGMGGASGDLAAVFSPAAAHALAGWLRDSAVIHLPDNECGYCDPIRNPLRLPCHALTVARALTAAAPA